MKRHVLLAAVIVLVPQAALAGPAADAVKFFYSPVKWEADPQYRDRFVEPAKTLFDLNDQTPEGEMGCIDFGPGVDAQDYDDATIKKTLKLDEKVDGDTAQVTANFTLFPEGEGNERQMLWTLKNVGGAWKIADIESVTNGWKLSGLECRPEN